MPKLLPPVEARHLIAVIKKVSNQHSEAESSDAATTAVTVLRDELSADQIMNVMHRLFALMNFLKGADLKPWFMRETGKDYVMLEESLIRARRGHHLKKPTTSKSTSSPKIRSSRSCWRKLRRRAMRDRLPLQESPNVPIDLGLPQSLPKG
jgi:hypothetical protein